MPNINALLRSTCALFLLAALSIAPGCSPIPALGETTAEDAYEIGVAAAEREDYLLAAEAFKRVTLDSPLHDYADDALVALADVHRAIGDYVSAEEEYRRLLSDYDRSPLIPEAEYKLGLAFFEQAAPAALDQGMTRQAISQFEYFIAAYPASEFVEEARSRVLELRSRLAAKTYESAMLYLTMGKPAAARVYLQAVVEEYPDTAWARKALLAEARSYAAEGADAPAAGAYQKLIDLYPGTEEAGVAAAERAAAQE